MSKQYKTAAIYLARAGVDGSSGDHRIRHTVLELNVTNMALDAIKQRHGFDGFHLIGQSGGSKLVGGMLALRTDIGCAVIGAGKPSPRRAETAGQRSVERLLQRRRRGRRYRAEARDPNHAGDRSGGQEGARA